MMATNEVLVTVKVDAKQAHRDLARLARRARRLNRQLKGYNWRVYGIALTSIDVGLGIWLAVR